MVGVAVIQSSFMNFMILSLKRPGVLYLQSEKVQFVFCESVKQFHQLFRDFSQMALKKRTMSLKSPKGMPHRD